MPTENHNQSPPPNADTSSGLVTLADLPQLYHARDAQNDKEPWQVSKGGSEEITSNAYNGVFYLTPHVDEAAYHVREAESPTIHIMDVVNPDAKVMNGKDFHPSFATILKRSVGEVVKPRSEFSLLALAMLSAAEKSEYTYNGAVFSLESNIKKFATNTLPDGIYPMEWETIVETYISALNAQRLLVNGDAGMILQGVLDYTINPNKSLVYGEIGHLENGDAVRGWIPINRQYLVGVLGDSNVVGVTKSIDRFGPPANTPTNTSVVFNEAVMLWHPEAVLSSGVVNFEQTAKLISTARAIGRIPLKGSVKT